MGCMLQFLDTWRVFGWLVDNLCAHVLHCLAAVAVLQFWRSPVRANESSNRGPTREDVPRPFFSFWNFQKACRARALGAIARRGSRNFRSREFSLVRSVPPSTFSPLRLLGRPAAHVHFVRSGVWAPKNSK